jgi:hypothetical protein
MNGFQIERFGPLQIRLSDFFDSGRHDHQLKGVNNATQANWAFAERRLPGLKLGRIA